MCLLPLPLPAGYEHRLLMSYNDKPLLTRPQQRFYSGDAPCSLSPSAGTTGHTAGGTTSRGTAASATAACGAATSGTPEGTAGSGSAGCAPAGTAGGTASGAAIGADSAAVRYLEADLDVHNYAFIARKALAGFTTRLAPVVFENAFVLQGGSCRPACAA